MRNQNLPARINVKVLVILVVCTGLLGVGVAVGHYVQKSMIADRALTAGRAALAEENWAEGAKHLRVYLSNYPDDTAVLKQYAEAHLAVRPMQPGNLMAAIAGYRRLLRHRPGDAEICHALARLYSAAGNHTEAAYICRERLKVAPSDPVARLWLARALTAQQKHGDAIEVLTALVEEHPDRVKAYSLLGSLLAQADPLTGPDKAKSWLDRAVENNPQSAEARVIRARFYRIVAPDAESAEQDLRAAVDLDPTDPTVLLMLAEEWTALGRYDQAASALRAVDELDPADYAADGGVDELDPAAVAMAKYVTQARLALQDPNFADPAELAERALAALEDQAVAGGGPFLPLAVRLFLAGGRVGQAKEQLEKFDEALAALKQEPLQNPEYRLLSARVALAVSEPYEAVRLLADAVRKRNPNPEALKVLGEAYQATGQVRRARAVLGQYVELVPHDDRALIELARTYRHDDWQRVATHAQAAFDRRPTLTAKLLVLEARLMEAGERGDATAMLERSAAELRELSERFPNDAAVRVLLAEALSRLGRTDEAVEELRAAIEACDDALAPAMHLVDLLVRTDRTEKAVELCREMIERFPEQSVPRIRLAECYRSLGSLDEARGTLEEAVRTLGGSHRTDAEKALARLLLAQGQREEAIRLGQRIALERPQDIGVRRWLLSLPDVRREHAEAQRLIDEVRGIEGAQGVLWKLEQAVFWLESGRWRERERETLDLLSTCLQLDPGWERAAVALGAAQEKQGKLREAEQAYRLALADNPGAVRVADRLIDLLKRQRRYADAEEVLRRLPDGGSGLIAQHIDLAVRQGRLRQAHDQLQRFISDAPDDVGARVRLAKLTYALHKDGAEALRILDQAAHVAPESLDVLAGKVAVLHEEGRSDEALAVLSQAVQQWESFAAYWIRAKYLATVGRIEDAEADYKRLTTFEASAPTGYLLLGRFYREQGRMDDALAAWEAGLAIDPDNATLNKSFVKGLIASGDPVRRRRAKAVLEDLQARYGDDPELLRLEAAVLLDEGAKKEPFDAAIRKLRRAVQLDPTDVDTHLKLIDLVRRQGDLTQVRSLVAQALSANPGHVELQAARVAVEAELGNLVAARELARSLLDVRPSEVGLRNRLSELFMRIREPELAGRINRETLARAPHDETANVIQAALLAGEGDVDTARSHLRAYVRDENNRAGVPSLTALAMYETAAANFGEADGLLSRAAEIAPRDARVIVGRLRWLAAQDRWEELSAEISEVRANSQGLAPGTEVLVAAGHLLASAQAPRYLRHARDLFEQVVENEPHNAEGFRGLARVDHALGEPSRAIEALRNVLKLRPNDVEATNNLAWILAHEADAAALDEALRLANRALAKRPEHVHLLDTRGVILLKLGRLEEARTELQRCISLSGQQPATRARAYLHLARVLSAQQAGREEIRRSLDQAEQIDGEQGVLSDKERNELQRLLDSL